MTLPEPVKKISVSTASHELPGYERPGDEPLGNAPLRVASGFWLFAALLGQWIFAASIFACRG